MIPESEAAQITALFRDSFSASEGPDEARMIEQLVRALLALPVDLRHVFTSRVDDAPVAGCVFTPLTFPDASRRVMLLSPVAVHPEVQRLGHGSTMIRNALETLAKQDIGLVVTYGDPAYYGRLGFQPITADQIAAPYTLSMPMGWQAVALDGRELAAEGTPECVPPFRNPDMW
ncbi:GNAT family N-acetyltransferase [Sagittula sp. SSi028]|uniref:GNAT family N-acetyltransferase n=1 Tax=Sagittula sp. SSi028 TaxID=3400636 RepID=UPI003AF5CF48